MTPVVMGLIVVCFIVWLLELANNKPTDLIVSGTLFRGPKAEINYALIPYAVHHGQSYRLITAAFMHASWEHIIFNMLTLGIIGPAVEAEIGKVRFLALFLISAVGGSVASYLLGSPYEVGLGASGAIFGVMGAYYVLARLRRWDTSAIVVLVVVNLIISFATPGIDWRAHIGGLLTGAAVAGGFSFGPAGSQAGARGGWSSLPTARLQEIGVVVAAAALLALLVQIPPGQVNL
jgi:membrane associated rhomboid family serine protease